MAKVFVSHVDKYTGKIIGKVLSESVVGATGGDDEEDEGEGEVGEGKAAESNNGGNYEVVGTLANDWSEVPTWIKETIAPANRDQLLSVLLSCDVIIYDISGSEELVEELTWAVQAVHDQLSSFASQKVFICISTILTWARTKPFNPDEPDVPFTEEDYRRRRCHPNFKEHITAEKLVIKLGKTDKSKFSTYVIASGLQYGCGEDIFHFLFKSAWLGKDSVLYVFGDGQNTVPMIHVRDLASVVVNIADIRPKVKYIVCVDESKNTLEEIVKSISKNLGTGQVKRMSKEDALFISDLSQCHYDQLLVNIQMEATCIKEIMKIDWKSETGLVENINDIIAEYKQTRGLLPIRICILGPPAVGKSTVAAQLCQYYKLHHIKIADVIQEAVEKLKRRANRADVDDEDEDDDDKAQEAKDHLSVLEDDKEENKGRYSTQHIIDFYKAKLKSMPCQNQGFVLDGFPKTEEEAKELFAPQDTDDDDSQQNSYNKLLMPELVVSLNGNNDFLKQRVMNLPQNQVAGTHNTEEGILRRLKIFREQNEEDVTVLNYFDELEIHPENINVAEDTSPNMEKTVEHIKKIIKEPRNYGPTEEEKREMERKALEEKTNREESQRKEMERQEALEKELRSKREAEWSERLAQVQREEQEMLETHSIPLRNYLMRHIMPTLTEGLVEICKVRPEDPVDYLAEFLFKHNPQID